MTDLATREHWDDEWARAKPAFRFGRYWPDRALERYVADNIDPRPGQRLVELGAGNSRYLPGLAKSFGLRVAGLDYSRTGLALARRSLDAEGIEGELAEGDLFVPPTGWEARFDIVLTMGVVEHFDDTAAVVRACSRYMAPGGRLLTVIPNMHGFCGIATRWLNRALYEKHRALTPHELADAHRQAELIVEHASYLIGFDAWVSNPAASTSRWKRWTYKPALALTRLAWLIDERFGLPRTRLASPWVVVLAKAPGDR